MKDVVDIVVVGTGPAGLSACRVLSRFNINTILVGRQYIPEKPCGGGLTRRCIKILSLVFPEYVEVVKSRIDNVYIVHRRGVYLLNSRGIMYTTLRKDFDRKFLKIVTEYEGVEYIPENVVKLFKRDYYYRLITDRGTIIDTKIVIACDGVYSKVRQCIEGFKCVKMPYAVRVYCKGWEYDNVAVLDFSRDFKFGYYWIFPVGSSEANIGVGYFKDNYRNIAKKLEEYIISIGLKKVSDVRGHVLPRNLHDITSRDFQILYAGDAAGFIDYTLGEGITYALLSGVLAAISYVKNSKEPGIVYREYARSIVSDLKITRNVGIYVPYMNDRILDLVIRKIITRGRMSVEILSGERTYYRAVKMLLNPGKVIRTLFKS